VVADGVGRVGVDVAGLETDDGLCANAVDAAACQALIGIIRDPLFIRRNQLKLERR
jgi:hypothetical protein